MAQDKIEIEIKMEDGSFRKAEIDLKKALEKGGESGAEGAAEKFSNLFSKKILVGGAIAAGVGAVIKKAFDFTLAGEQIAQINGQFEMLAKRANISGEALKNALMGAAGGLVDDEEILKATSKALIELGSSAEKLPQIMGLARQASSLFGGEITQNFELINQAIASGNTRSLRSIGIYIDQNKALQDFAKANGGAAEALSQTGKQQAILNAVLEKGGVAFKGVKDLTPVTSEFKKLKVSIGELGDALAVSSASTFGPFFESMIRGAARATSAITGMFQSLTGGRATPAADTLKYLESQLKRIQGNLTGNYSDTVLTQMKSQAEMLKIQIEDLRKSQLKFGKDSDGLGANAGDKADPLFNADPNAAKKTSDFESQLMSVRSQTLAIEEARAQAMVEGQAKQETLEVLALQRKGMISQEFELKREALNLNADLSEQQRVDMRIALAEQEAQAIGQIDAKLQADRISNNQKAMAMISNTLGNGLGQGMAAFGGALAQGKNGFAAFGKSVLSTLGNLAIQLGQMFILVGMAQNATAGLFGLSGGAAIAAGIGLSVLGGALSSIGGGGGSSPNGDTGGGVSAGGGGLLQTDSVKQAEAKKSTDVQVVVQGNVLDRRETGLAIVETINEYFNTSDGRITRGSFA